MSFIGLDRIISVWTSLDTAWTAFGHVLERVFGMFLVSVRASFASLDKRLRVWTSLETAWTLLGQGVDNA